MELQLKYTSTILMTRAVYIGNTKHELETFTTRHTYDKFRYDLQDPDRLFRRFRPSHPDLGLTCITHTYLLADHACHPMSSHNDTTNNENTKRISAFSTMD